MLTETRNLVYNKSATPLNRTGKEPGTGTLSQPFANQTKLYFGLRITRLITGLFKGVATANSNRSDWAGNFNLTENRQAGLSVSPRKPALSKANPQEKAMPNRDFTNSPLDGQDLTHLSGPELSALLDLITSQIEFHRDELTRLRPILHRLEGNIPNDSFAEFISSLELGE